MSRHTDIRSEGWVARLPSRWRAYALLMRLDRPIGSWLLLLPGLWAFAIAAPDWRRGLYLSALFALGAVLMRGAGCVINDLWDRDLDARVARTARRPLAAGLVTPRQALILLGLLLVLAAVILVQLHPTAILLGLASLIPITLYPLAKRFTDWPQAVLGVVFSWAAPTGYAAATGVIDAVALALWTAGFFWILGYDTIYAHQDREDDALVGIRSTARKFGERTRPFLAVCYGVTIAFLLLAGWLAALAWSFAVAMLLPAALLAAQVIRLDIHNPQRCLELFKANREVGLAVALAFLFGRL